MDQLHRPDIRITHFRDTAFGAPNCHIQTKIFTSSTTANCPALLADMPSSLIYSKQSGKKMGQSTVLYKYCDSWSINIMCRDKKNRRNYGEHTRVHDPCPPPLLDIFVADHVEVKARNVPLITHLPCPPGSLPKKKT